MRTELIDAGENTKLEFLASEAIALLIRAKSSSFFFANSSSNFSFEREDLRLLVIYLVSYYSDPSLREKDLLFLRMC